MKVKYLVVECVCPDYESASFQVIHETFDIDEAFQKLDDHENSLAGTWKEDESNCYVQVVRPEK